MPLSTPRLCLRPYLAADAPEFFAVLDQGREQLRPAFPARVAAVRTPADATRVLDAFRHDWDTNRLYVLGIWETATGRYVGDISLKPNWSTPVTLEIGYYLAAAAQGRGYAREAVAAAVQFGFGLHPGVARLLIRCQASNPRSCAVAEHAGFRLLEPRPWAWPLRWRATGTSADAIRHYLLRRPA